MRSFPSALVDAIRRSGRPRPATTALAFLLVGALALPLAHAEDKDDLKDKQRKVEGKIEATHDHLDDVSAQAVRASRRVQATRARLATARTHLAKVEGRLAAAQKRDNELKAQVVSAKQDLTTAREQLKAGRLAVEDQKHSLRTYVLDVFTHGGSDPKLRVLGSFLDNGTLEEISNQLLAETVVRRSSTDTYDELIEIEAALTEQKDDVKAAKEAVEAKQAEAAEHLAAMKKLAAQAQAARDQVAGLVTRAQQARRAALAAKKRDQAILAKLKKEEKRIKDKLLELARRDNSKGYRGNQDGLLEWPAPGPISSPYGWRVHPIYGYKRFHDGLDIAANCGSSAIAAAPGKVIDAYYSSGYGYRMFLSIGNVNGKNVVLVYNHLSSFVASVGQQVKRGQVIAKTGTTGLSTGCHLHFMVLENGSTVDPMTYL